MSLSLKIEDFTWSFLRTIVSWSVLLGLLIIVAAVFYDASTSFMLSFLLAAAIDVGSLWFMSWEGHKHVEEGTPTTNYIGGMTVGRILGKSILLLLAALVPALDFLGVVLGVLLVDTTILIIGSIASAWKVMRDDGTGWNTR